MVRRRDKACYDDECCIAAGELDDDDETSSEITPKMIENGASKKSNGSPSGSVSRTAKVSPHEPKASIAKKQRSVDTNNDDDDGRMSIEETRSKSKSRSPSVVSSTVHINLFY